MTSLILQMTGILFPILIYQTFWNKALDIVGLKRKMIFATLTFCSIFFCMSYSIPLFGYHYDMRDVPLFLGILYGGYDVGIVVSFITIVYRFFIGTLPGSLASLLVHAIVLPFLFFGIRRYARYSHDKRVKAATTIGFFFSCVAVAISIIFAPQTLFDLHHWAFSLGFMAVNTLGMGITVFLLEKGRENESLKHELQETEKLRVVGHLAASIAHEVRNPLTVVRGFIQLLMKEEIQPEKRLMYSQMIINELDRAQLIITDYLTFARPEFDSERAEVSDVKRKILDAVNIMLAFGTVHGVDIETHLENDLYIHTDKQKFTQVMVNLIKNAIESMPTGGTVTIRSARMNQYVAIDIIDHGVGMSTEQLQRLGYPFYSTKDKGTGLGLMVCYRIIQSLNGKIEVTSQAGKGTHFVITIPLVAPSVAVNI